MDIFELISELRDIDIRYEFEVGDIVVLRKVSDDNLDKRKVGDTAVVLDVSSPDEYPSILVDWNDSPNGSGWWFARCFEPLDYRKVNKQGKANDD